MVAHEYGHHLQNLEGILKPGSGAGAEGTALRTELMADCLAGVWANNAAGIKKQTKAKLRNHICRTPSQERFHIRDALVEQGLDR